MKIFKISKTGLAIATLFFLVSMAVMPLFPAISDDAINAGTSPDSNTPETIKSGAPTGDENNGVCQMYDTLYVPEEDVSLAGIQNDIGYNVDAGDSILKSLPIYIGEPVNLSVPGRGRTGALDPGSNDNGDWYSFSVCEGQSIQMSLVSGEDYDFEFLDPVATPIENGHTADVTGTYFLHIFANEDTDAGDYTIDLILGEQNDAGNSVQIPARAFLLPWNPWRNQITTYICTTRQGNWYILPSITGRMNLNILPMHRAHGR